MGKPATDEEEKSIRTFLRKHSKTPALFRNTDRVAVLSGFFLLLGFAVYWTGHALPLWALLLTGKIAGLAGKEE